MQAQQKWNTPGGRPDKANRLVGEDVRGESRDYPHSAAGFDLRILGDTRSTPESVELVISVVRREVPVQAPDVPLSDEGRRIPGSLQQLRPSRQFRIKSLVRFLGRIEVIGNPDLRAVAAGQQTGAGGAAYGSGRERVRESYSFGVQAVDVGRSRLAVPQGANRP